MVVVNCDLSEVFSVFYFFYKINLLYSMYIALNKFGTLIYKKNKNLIEQFD